MSSPKEAASPGVWVSAWRSAARRPAARLALAWLGLVALLAVLAPVVSSGHPLIEQQVDAAGNVVSTASPLARHLSHVDVLLLSLGLSVPAAWAVGSVVGRRRMLLAGALVLSALATVLHPRPPALETFDQYARNRAAGTHRQVYVLNPWSPRERHAEARFTPPGGEVAGRRVVLGTDALGQDVLSQVLHASRLSISVGVIAAGVAIGLGVIIGALMGYFGGWVDAVLLRVVEVFMSVPTLLLLVTAAAVLPRNTYVLMAVIGCCSWTGAARFTRAEFLRLRELDWVAAARATGLRTPSIILRHMLPAAITPVLVEAGFAMASAILAEASLSYLGLGPAEQPSWGRLLSDAVSGTGEFHWWLGVFPGGAIFATVLSANVLSEATRAAMSPKDEA
ncbi:MAG: ABC transporter permease [Phycisphaerales bacterium]